MEMQTDMDSHNYFTTQAQLLLHCDEIEPTEMKAKRGRS